ncbi:hypothetical protein I6E46_06300 [Prevotella loescheii]|nr:hypothetical protein [Hoylesella loescheii]
MSKRASRRRGKEGQELSDIDTGYTSRSLRGAQKEGQKLSDIDTGYTSRGLHGAQKEGQEDSERGSERMGYRHRKRG